MTAITRPTPKVLLLLCSTAAILMTLTGFLFLIGTRLVSVFANGDRFIGETDAISIALIFGGIGVALKTTEIRVREEHSTTID